MAGRNNQNTDNKHQNINSVEENEEVKDVMKHIYVGVYLDDFGAVVTELMGIIV